MRTTTMAVCLCLWLAGCSAGPVGGAEDAGDADDGSDTADAPDGADAPPRRVILGVGVLPLPDAGAPAPDVAPDASGDVASAHVPADAPADVAGDAPGDAGGVADAGTDAGRADAPDAPADAPAASAPWLAFVSRRSGNQDVWAVRADGTGLRQLTTSPAIDTAPAWVPGGARLVFASARGAGGWVALYTHDLATGAEAPVATGVLSATAPRVSPDGATVVFEGGTGGGAWPDVYAVPLAGGVATRLTTDPGTDASPVWSRDGAALYFVSNRTGAFEIYRMAPDGTGQHAVTTDARILGRFDLTADARTAVFVRPAPGATYPLVARDLASGADTVLAPDGDTDPALAPDGARLAVTTLAYGPADPEIALRGFGDAAAPARLAPAAGIDSLPAWAL